MARNFSLTLSFFLATLLIHGCSSALLLGEQEFLWQNVQQQQQHRLLARTDCRVETHGPEPTLRYESEAGRTEFWDRNNQQFEERNSGNCDSGCAETYESGSQSQSDRRRRFTDRHQKVRQFRQGDVIALPAGLTLWFYNNGNEPLVTVALLDTGNEANQLDQQFRNFFLAGSPRGGTQSPYGQRERGEEQGQRNNIFHGFDEELLAEIFGVDIETARRLRGRDDQRGQIVRAEKFNIVLPGEEEERRERGHWPANGLEETLCTKKLIENIDSPKRADTYNPAAAASAPSTAKSSPFSSGSVLVPRKESYTEFQVVGHTGKSVFDGDVREGQMIIVPQNYVVVKRASEDEGLEWISFKTNDNAVTSQLAGRLSAIRAFPLEVVMNSYGVSREEAMRLKYGREESRVFSSTSRSRSPRPKPFEYALDVIKSMIGARREKRGCDDDGRSSPSGAWRNQHRI
ncbi:hypothetical protein DH2020_004679 [Rehmannia glutinosa]|uniref:Cupin type-1 domain-containing protein n=1 Tax=Rehmannia glutinosa TaxID=99300 RepID=A0ABR0XQ16_REHGL